GLYLGHTDCQRGIRVSEASVLLMRVPQVQIPTFPCAFFNPMCPLLMGSTNEMRLVMYLRQAVIDHPARPTGPRPDAPRNYGPDMNCQELERMQ
ncbi:hypothetical protein Tco_0648542, partial [Tanacetum coccineum]